MRPRCPLPILLLTATLATTASVALGDPPASPSNEARLQGAYRFEKDGWIYVHLEGSPERIGFQHGSLAGRRDRRLPPGDQALLQEVDRRDWASTARPPRRCSGRGSTTNIAARSTASSPGWQAKGVDADRWDLVALNANQELPYYYVPWVDRREGKTPDDARPRQLQRLHRHGQAHAGTAGSSWATTPGPITSSARAGTSSSTSSRKPARASSWTACPA